MPRWETTDLGDGRQRHELNGRAVGARVEVMPNESCTMVVLVLVDEGIDPLAVDRCKLRAERLFGEALRGTPA